MRPTLVPRVYANAWPGQGVTVASDIHADREYRSALISIQVRRALETAIERAG
jgi:hypothetical protein